MVIQPHQLQEAVLGTGQQMKGEHGWCNEWLKSQSAAFLCQVIFKCISYSSRKKSSLRSAMHFCSKWGKDPSP